MQSAALLLLLGLAAVASASENFFRDPQYDEEKGVAGKGCCLPTQWEGRVGSFYMRKRLFRPIIKMSDSKVGLDFKNKRVGARSMFYCRRKRKVYNARSVADYKSKKAYFIYKNKCKVFRIKSELKKPCVPDYFKRFAGYNYGAGSASLNLSPYGTRDSRLEYFLVVTKRSCVPIKGAYRTRKGKRTITYGKYQYYNITTGNSDKKLYKIPSFCNSSVVEDAPSGVLDRVTSYMRKYDTPFAEDSDLSPVSDEAMSHMSELINGNAMMAQKSKPSRAGRWLRKKWSQLREKFD